MWRLSIITEFFWAVVNFFYLLFVGAHWGWRRVSLTRPLCLRITASNRSSRCALPAVPSVRRHVTPFSFGFAAARQAGEEQRRRRLSAFVPGVARCFRVFSVVTWPFPPRRTRLGPAARPAPRARLPPQYAAGCWPVCRLPLTCVFAGRQRPERAAHGWRMRPVSARRGGSPPALPARGLVDCVGSVPTWVSGLVRPYDAPAGNKPCLAAGAELPSRDLPSQNVIMVTLTTPRPPGAEEGAGRPRD